MNENTFVMTNEPSKNITIQELRKSFLDDNSEQHLADVYALVNNKVAWLADELYEDKNLKSIYDEWDNFSNELFRKIEIIINERKLPIPNPKKTYIHRGEQFMYIYGWIDSQGWWRKKL